MSIETRTADAKNNNNTDKLNNNNNNNNQAPAAPQQQPTKAKLQNNKLFAIKIIEFVVALYDFFTLPLYYLFVQPWKVRANALKQRAKLIDDYTWQNVEVDNRQSPHPHIDTLDQLFRESVAKFGPKNALGVRKVLGVEYKGDASKLANDAQKGSNEVGGKTPPAHHNSLRKNTSELHLHPRAEQKPKVVAKYDLDEKFTWYTYTQIETIVKHLSAGLTSLCADSLDVSDGTRKLLIAGDTCMQWFLIAHACFRNNITLVTTYTTLADEAILHSIQQTEVKTLVSSQKFSKRLPKILALAPTVETVILLDEPLPGDEDECDNIKAQIKASKNVKRVLTYNEIVEHGSKIEEKILNAPTANDVAVLMYTSGSTGKAKGVMLTQKNIVYTAMSFIGPGDIYDTDRYLGYLPLGHVLELSAECIFMRNGSTIAYSSPMTLTSQSPLIKKGAKGDAELFKPTIMAAVPLVLDRLKSAIHQKVKSQGALYDQLINDWLVRYKRYWYDRYYTTPILNYLLCRKFNMILGGKLRTICSGGAALSEETHEYLRHVTNFTLFQGYGLTETSAAGSFCDIDERRYNVVGGPYMTMRIKLVDWSDYSVKDKPYPRGEIIMGGDSVSDGYYKLEEQTKESFYVDEKGVRWFRTGDIGLMLPDGVLKIIDRKKDLVKPLCGEYISLSEIELAMSTSQLIDNICVYCSQFSNYIVALVRPNSLELKLIAKSILENLNSELSVKLKKSLLEQEQVRDDIELTELITDSIVNANTFNDYEKLLHKLSVETLCNNKELNTQVKSIIKQIGNERKLKKHQIPANIKLVAQEWTPENHFITASFKLRRRELEKYYAKDIEALYAEIGEPKIRVNL